MPIGSVACLDSLFTGRSTARRDARNLHDRPRAERRRVSRSARVLFPEQKRAAGLDAAANLAPRQSLLPHRGGRNRDLAATGVAMLCLPLFQGSRSGDSNFVYARTKTAIAYRQAKPPATTACRGA